MSFCIYSIAPVSVVFVADVIISPIPCVYSYVFELYVLVSLLKISLGLRYTSVFSPFISNSSKNAKHYIMLMFIQVFVYILFYLLIAKIFKSVELNEYLGIIKSYLKR